MPAIRVLLLAVAGMLFSGLSYAQSGSSGFRLSLEGNRAVGLVLQDIGAATNTGAVSAVFPGYTYPDGVQRPTLQAATSAPVPRQATRLPIVAKAGLSALAIGKGLAKSLAFVAAWETGSKLYDIWADVGLQLDASGQVIDPSAGLIAQSSGYCLNVNSVCYFDLREGSIARLDYSSSGSSYNYTYISHSAPGSSITIYWSRVAKTGGNYSTGSNVYGLSYNPTACPVGYYVYPGNSCSTVQPAGPVMTEQDVANHIAALSGWPSSIAPALRDAARFPEVQQILADDAVQRKPLIAIGTPGAEYQSADVGSPVVTEQVTQNPDGTTTTRTRTTTTTAEVSSDGDAIEYTDHVSETTTVRDAQGNPVSTSTSTTTTPKTSTTTADGTEVIVCGLPDTPPCAIDETGTPGAPEVEAMQIDKAADDWNQQMQDLKDTVTGPDDKGFLDGWRDFFITPPLAACAPFVLPGDRGEIDPCPVVDSVRSVMAYIWALTGLWLCIGMVRQVIVKGG